PLLILTADSEIEVRGTDLVVSSDAQSTELVVSSGHVRMVRRVDGKEAHVSGGQMTSSSGQRSMEACPVPVIPATWNESFDFRIPNGWEGGLWSPGDADAQGLALIQ